MSEPYWQHTVHMFYVDFETWEITTLEADYLCVSETAKNGQEDCHVEFEVNRDEHGVWVIEDRDMLNMYWSDETADEIETHLNKYPPPQPEVERTEEQLEAAGMVEFEIVTVPG